MDTPNDNPPVRHFVRTWNDDGTVREVREVPAPGTPDDFAAEATPLDDSGWVPLAPGVKQIKFTVEGYMEKM